jgi:UDP-4-amino-4,6-dideoxy-N-acetyl-beta-L-altrosamine transaminase
MIPYGRQNITDEDIDAVIKVLKSDFITQGPAVEAFEASLCAITGANAAVAVNSATSALHIACSALGLGPGDFLWTVPNTFLASANAAVMCGAKVDFVDIDPLTYNMSPQKLADKLAEAERCRQLPKIVMPVHFSGQSCDMPAIKALSDKYGFRIIEDASHAIGGSYQERAVGSCSWSDVTVFSFHPVKIITTGEGGAAVTKNAELARRMQLLRSHGMTRNSAEMFGSSEGPWYYQQVILGYNYRMTDIQAALGLSQINRLSEYIELRQRLADRYDALLADLPILTPKRDPNARSSWHLYCIQIDDSRTQIPRHQVFNALRERQIGVNVHYIPVYWQPFYQSLGSFQRGYCPEAERYYNRAITLPLFATMTHEQQDAVVAALRDILLP